MGLFSKFTDTIILKETSELQKKYGALERLAKEYPNNTEVKEELFRVKQGLDGEKEILYQLKKSNLGLYVLHDINLQYQDLKAQIDFVVISPMYCYFIECKNLYGNITVNEQGDFVREYQFNGKKIVKGMYSPLRQVEAQRDVYKKIWNLTLSSNPIWNSIKRKIAEKNFKDTYRILVVAANNETILNTKNVPNGMKNQIIRSDSLVRRIEEDLNNSDKTLWENQKSQEEWARHFLIHNYEPNIIYYDYYKDKYHLAQIKEITKSIYEKKRNDIKEKLKSLRKDISQEVNIPAYYIFNNEELDKILETMPKTIEELRKILPEIKVKCHGEKILGVINKENS